MPISLPATSDYWVNDRAPVTRCSLITAEANAGLVKMLPEILAQVRALVDKLQRQGETPSRPDLGSNSAYATVISLLR